METRRLGQKTRDLLLRSRRTPRLPGRVIGENGLGDVGIEGEARTGHARMKFLPQRFRRAIGNRGVASLPLRHALHIAAPIRPPPRANRARMSATAEVQGRSKCPWSMGFQRESRILPFAAVTGKARHSPQGATAGRGSGHESPGRGCKGRGSPLRDGSRESGSLHGRDATPKCCPQPGRARCPQAPSDRLTASPRETAPSGFAAPGMP